MDNNERKAKIVDYLRVKSITHGQVETCLLRLGTTPSLKMEPDRWAVLKQSLQEQGTNLIPLLVRRIEPDEDDREYEVVFGADWFIVAEDLGIARLWVWVFDLNLDQAEVAYEEMLRLTQQGVNTVSLPNSDSNTSPSLADIGKLIDRKLEPIADTSTQSSEPLQNIAQLIDDKLEKIAETLSKIPPDPSSSVPSSAGDSLGAALNQLIYECKSGGLKATVILEGRKVLPDPNAEMLRELYQGWTVKQLKPRVKAMGGQISGSPRKPALIEMLVDLHRKQG